MYFKRLHTLRVFVPPHETSATQPVGVIDFASLPTLVRLSWLRGVREYETGPYSFLPGNNKFPFKIGSTLKELMLYNQPLTTSAQMIELLKIADAIEVLRIEVGFAVTAKMDGSKIQNGLTVLWQKIGQTVQCLYLTICSSSRNNGCSFVEITKWCSKLVVLHIKHLGRIDDSWLRWWFSDTHIVSKIDQNANRSRSATK